MRVEARVVQQRRRAPDPGCDEGVARRLAPAAGGRAPDEVAGSRREPVLGLQRLAGEVALAVDDGLRLAGRAARERDQARVLGRQVGRGRRLELGRSADARADDRGAVPARLRQNGVVALVADDERGRAGGEAQAQVAGAQLLVAGQHDVALAKAGDHRHDPVGAVADERQDSVAAPHALFVQPRGERACGARDLPEGPLVARAVAGQFDERQAPGRRGLDDALSEVRHRGAQSRTMRSRLLRAGKIGGWRSLPPTANTPTSRRTSSR